jgi:hypothetical protein
MACDKCSDTDVIVFVLGDANPHRGQIPALDNHIDLEVLDIVQLERALSGHRWRESHYILALMDGVVVRGASAAISALQLEARTM